MKGLKWILLLFCLAKMMACRTDSLGHNVKKLEGEWRRVWSTDYRSDSMIVSLKGDSAVITYVSPNNDFMIGQVKWLGIMPVVDENFELYDLSVDSSLGKARMEMLSDTNFFLINLDYPDAPGGKQTWVKL